MVTENVLILKITIFTSDAKARIRGNMTLVITVRPNFEVAVFSTLLKLCFSDHIILFTSHLPQKSENSEVTAMTKKEVSVIFNQTLRLYFTSIQSPSTAEVR